MKHRPPTRAPAVPASRQAQKIASWVDAGPGSRFMAATPSSNSVAVIQPRRCTHNWRSRAMCAGGPPNPRQPIRPHSLAITRSEADGGGCAPGSGCWLADTSFPSRVMITKVSDARPRAAGTSAICPDRNIAWQIRASSPGQRRHSAGRIGRVSTFIAWLDHPGTGPRIAVKDLIDVRGVPTTADCGCQAVAEAPGSRPKARTAASSPGCRRAAPRTPAITSARRKSLHELRLQARARDEPRWSGTSPLVKLRWIPGSCRAARPAGPRSPSPMGTPTMATARTPAARSGSRRRSAGSPGSRRRTGGSAWRASGR